MNDTRRDALVEKMTGILDARSQLTATELSHRDICQDANELVEAVTRHRDAEIREALESEGLVAMFARMMWTQDGKPTATPSSAYYMAARYNLDTIVKHIGLGDGTGGQG